ncbi:PREDICTED: uncharacterized protein LOC105506479 [Colobus angolensis palliatus]|uniref:uncharacterized protein LOC105506479 n=1 Tax=Colobus angolensis palliatus TaxID=336983 RepID=UPI0005F44CAD|nr:PREDICTED: uncharacterized protein LOC105506479 [Colobus angolensis palliatus]
MPRGRRLGMVCAPPRPGRRQAGAPGVPEGRKRRPDGDTFLLSFLSTAWLKTWRSQQYKELKSRSCAREQMNSSSCSENPPCSPKPWPCLVITSMRLAGPRHQGSERPGTGRTQQRPALLSELPDSLWR